MSRRVDDIDAHLDVVEQLDDIILLDLSPATGGGCGSDGNTAFTFLLHPIGGGRSLVHLADLMDHAGIEKNPLGQCCLARVDMGANPDITGAIQRKGAIRGIRIGCVYCGCFGAHRGIGKNKWKKVYRSKIYQRK